jgi:hypothetical protein
LRNLASRIEKINNPTAITNVVISKVILVISNSRAFSTLAQARANVSEPGIVHISVASIKPDHFALSIHAR